MRTFPDGRPALRPPLRLAGCARREEILTVCAATGAAMCASSGPWPGNPEEDSDLDLLVGLAPGTGLFTGTNLIGRQPEDLLGRAVDVIEEESLKERIRPRVLAEAVPMRSDRERLLGRWSRSG
jgi:hypothetical protein